MTPTVQLCPSPVLCCLVETREASRQSSLRTELNINRKGLGPQTRACRPPRYQFTGEDHTLGNALRYMLMKDPDVEFAGYTAPKLFNFYGSKTSLFSGMPSCDLSASCFQFN